MCKQRYLSSNYGSKFDFHWNQCCSLELSIKQILTSKARYADCNINLDCYRLMYYLGKHLLYDSMLNGDTTLWVHRVCGARLKKQKPGNRNHQVKFIEQGLHNSAHTWQIRGVREVRINLNCAVNFLLWCQEDLQLQWTVSTLPYLQQEHLEYHGKPICLLWVREGIPCSITSYY